MVGITKGGSNMADYYIDMSNERRNMMTSALKITFDQQGPDTEGIQKLAFKLFDFDLKNKRMPINEEEQRLLRNAINELRNKRIAEGKYTDFVDDALMDVLQPKRTKHFPW